MLDAGISAADIARLAQIAGYESAFAFCYYLDDQRAAYEGVEDDGGSELDWGLFLVDPDTDEPLEPLRGLHESILMADPSGREMRP
jgi:hypothetical protein